MRIPPNLLNLLIRHDAFRVCRLLSARDFARHCNERGLKVAPERLRQFERIGIFKPMLRVFRPEITWKIETFDGKFRYLDALRDGEVWEGETHAEIAAFGNTTKSAKGWRNEGLLWVPGQGAWPHEATIDTLPDQHEAYYSQFQLYPLTWIVPLMTMTVELEWATLDDGSLNPKFSPRLRHRAAVTGNRFAEALKGPTERDMIAVLLQLIANRFYYKTQGDGRQITQGHFHDWDWSDYARSWRPLAFKRAMQLTDPDSVRQYESLDIAWQNADPLAKWYNLARFVRLEKRKRLKDKALQGVALREMAQMMRLFHAEAFSSSLRPIGEVGVQIFKRIPDIDPDDDPMRSLEFVANAFGVNAKPQLVLIVEGPTEQAVIPVLFERLWAAPMSRYGIEIVNMGGVDNAAGGKAAQHSALWLLVDYLHHRQTLAFIILDNEGLAKKNVGERLPKAVSVHSSARKATRPDQIKIWRTCFELENFSDSELASALNMVAGVNEFTRQDIASCRTSVEGGLVKGQKLLTIDRLYEQRMGAPLDKPRLGEVLAGILCDPKSRRSPGKRPIVQVLLRAARKAVRNFQPVTAEDWDRNQRSGYVGTLQPEAKRDRKRQRENQRRKRNRAIARARKSS